MLEVPSLVTVDGKVSVVLKSDGLGVEVSELVWPDAWLVVETWMVELSWLIVVSGAGPVSVQLTKLFRDESDVMTWSFEVVVLALVVGSMFAGSVVELKDSSLVTVGGEVSVVPKSDWFEVIA